MEISVGSILTEGVALATLAVGAWYVAKAVQAREAAEVAGTKGNPPLTPEIEPAYPPQRDEGILGLMGGSRSEPLPASFASNSASRMQVPSTPAVPVFIDPATAARERRVEEVAWAFAALSDLGAISTVLLDADGVVLRAEGVLIQADAEMTGIAQHVSQLSEREVLDVTSNAQFPFLDKTVRSVAYYPVGKAGAGLVIASAESGFFGAMELRVADAVAARLATFFGVAAELEQGR